MKLIISVVNDNDVAHLLSTLIKEGYRATKLASTGGFLREGNTTILMGIEDEQVDAVVSIIGNLCHARKQLVHPLAPLVDVPDPYAAFPLEVEVGGARIFIVDIEKSLKV